MNYSIGSPLPFIKSVQETFGNNLAQTLIYFPLTVFTNYGVILFALLVSSSIILYKIYYAGIANERKVSSSEKQKYGSGRSIPMVSYFPVRLPSVISGFYSLYRFQNHGLKFLEELNYKYGNIFELPIATQRKAVAVFEPSAVNKILASSSPFHLNKPLNVYKTVFPNTLSDGLVASEYPIWFPHRKLLSRCFTYRSLQSYLPYMNQHGRTLIKQLKLACSIDPQDSVNGRQLDDAVWSQTVNIIMQTIAGEGILDGERFSKGQEAVKKAKEIVIYRMCHPELLIEPLWNLHPFKKELAHNIEVLNEICMKEIEKYKVNIQKTGVNFEAGVEDVDAVGIKKFRSISEELLLSGLPDKEILEEVATIQIAGHETTYVAVNMILFHLATNPECQKLCHEEVEGIMGSTRKENELEHDLTMDDLSNLKYLERCILEGMRLTAIVPTFMRRMDAPLKLDDNFTLEPGTTVLLSPWVMHRDPKNFPNPTKFDPDRFLPEIVKERNSGAFIPFSSGVRNCIGYKFAMMEVKTILALLLLHFEVFTTDKPEDINYFMEVTLLPDRKINLILKRRQTV